MQAVVKLYRSDEGYAVFTDATDEREFIASASMALSATEDDPDAVGQYLAHFVDIVCKLRGYKAPTVTEKRVLIAGSGILPADALVVEANGRGVVRAEAA